MLNKVQNRYTYLLIFFFFLSLILSARAFQLTILHHQETINDDEKPSYVTNLLRGNIYSQTKDALAISLPFYSLYIYPELIDPQKIQQYKDFLKLFDLSQTNIEKILTSHKKFKWIYRMLPKKTFLKIKKLEGFLLSGINYVVEYKRVYPYQDLASSVIGFTNIDGKGLAGIEYSLEKFLKPSFKNHNIGYDVVLTLNTKLQKEIENILTNTAKELKPQSISALIMEADTGKILTMASYPTFNINTFNQYEDPRVFMNTNISSIDEPGSTFKPLIMTYLFDKNVINESQRFYANGKAVINGLTIKDASNHLLGLLTPREILVKSSNIGMAKASAPLKIENLYLFLKNIGAGEKTGIPLPAEEKGIVRTPENMSKRSKLVIPIGQEIGLTPLQLVKAFSAIANGGVMVSPQIIDHFEYQGKIIHLEEEKQDFLHPAVRIFTTFNSQRILSYMRDTVTQGTARLVSIPNEWIAAKTGTAQVFSINKGIYDKVNTSVLAIYRPHHSLKKYIIYGVIRDPNTSLQTSWGGTLGARMVKQCIEVFRMNYSLMNH